jgi:two-component sensor histidine kinase
MREDVLRQHSHCDRPPSEDRLLFDELTHRINNELAAAIGIVTVAAARSSADEVKVALGRVRERLESCARVQLALQIPEDDTLIDASIYLRQLCGALVGSKLDWKGVELTLRAHPMLLHSVQCWRMGLIVAELVTNSARHAFIGRGGLVDIELGRCGPVVECRVEDDGCAVADVRP